jgi:hypothetical protein
MSNQETFKITYDFEVSGDSKITQSVSKAVQAVDKLNQANETSARAFQVAEKAGLHYSQAMERFFDKGTGKIIAQADAAKRLAQANEGLNKKGGGLDRGDLFDIAGNLGVGGEALGLFRDLTTASGLFGASLIAVSAGINLVKGAIEADTKAFEAQIASIARTSGSLDEYIAKRKEAAEAHPVAAFSQNIQAAGAQSITDIQKDPLSLFTQTASQRGAKIAEEVKANQKAQVAGEFALGELATERIKKLGQEVTKLGEQDASLNEIFQKTLEIKVATGEITKADSESADFIKQHGAEILQVAKGYQAIGKIKRDQAGMDDYQQKVAVQRADYQKSRQAEADQAGAIATRLRGQLVELQTQSNDAIAGLAEQHQKRLAAIAQNGASQRVSIEASYAKQLAGLAEGLQEQRESIVSQNTERIVDLEKQTQASRSKAIEDYAKRNEDIEAAYQERLKAIQQNYSDSLFDIEARRDARALVSARKSRDKDIRDADASREKDKKQAVEDHQTNQRNLETALRKQLETIRNDQAKRLDEAQNAYQKQLSAAQKARAEQLQALTRSQAEARQAEQRGYAESLTALTQQFASRRAALITALASEAKLTTEYGRKIIESLKGVLNPKEISEAIKKFQDAVNAKVTIKIEPIASVSNTAPSSTGVPLDAGGVPFSFGYADGGYIASARNARLHANEVVLPLSNPQRTSQLLRQYVSPRSGGVMRQEVNGRITVDGSAVDAAMKSQLSSELTRIFSEALTASNRG